MEYKHIIILPVDDQAIIKLKRTFETIAGITAKGVVVTIHGAIDALTDDELLELMSIPQIPPQVLSGKR